MEDQILEDHVKEAFLVLGFTEDMFDSVKEKDVVKAYFKLAKNFHPDGMC